MRLARENYTSFMIAGLVLTLALIGAFGVYSWRETNRLALAAEELTTESVRRGAVCPNLVKKTSPPICQPDALLPMRAARIGATNIVRFNMRERTLYRIWFPQAAFVGQRRKRCPKPVRCHLICTKTHAPKRRVKCVFAHDPG